MANNYWDPKQIKNAEMVLIVEMLDTDIVELSLSETAGVTAFLEYDYDRLVTYSAQLRTTNDAMAAKPRADFTYSKDTTHDITYQSENLDFSKVANEHTRLFMRYFADMMMQNARCDSANARSGITEPDFNRNVIALDRLDIWLQSYQVGGTPDTPQQSAYERAQRAGVAQ